MRQIIFDYFFKTQKEAIEFSGNPNRKPVQTIVEIPRSNTGKVNKYIPVAERKPIPLGPASQRLYDHRHDYDHIHKEKKD